MASYKGFDNVFFPISNTICRGNNGECVVSVRFLYFRSPIVNVNWIWNYVRQKGSKLIGETIEHISILYLDCSCLWMSFLFVWHPMMLDCIINEYSVGNVEPNEWSIHNKFNPVIFYQYILFRPTLCIVLAGRSFSVGIFFFNYVRNRPKRFVKIE